mmetsp:Transcript_30990/g.23046  ORF Transcript_30990/g.23046 Transcript_30990/m.23046 type:complete len:90 (-) Transcript_30990:49-318(-)
MAYYGTMVLNVSDTKPMYLQCFKCGFSGNTIVKRRKGLCYTVNCIIWCSLFMWPFMPFCPLVKPLFDYWHMCQKCETVLAVKQACCCSA